MSGIHKYLIASVMILINFYVINSEQNLLDTYGVSAETSAKFLELYRDEIANKFGNIYDLNEKRKEKIMGTLVNRLYLTFSRIREFSMFTPKEFIHYMILSKQHNDNIVNKSLYSVFLSYYKNGLDRYYTITTMMDISKIDVSIAKTFYAAQVMFYLRVCNSYYVDSVDPLKTINQFLIIMIEYARKNLNKQLEWSDSLREIINSQAEQKKLRMRERPSYKVVVEFLKNQNTASSSNFESTKENEIDVIIMIEDNLEPYPMPPRENKYFNIAFGNYLLFIELYSSEIYEYFEKMHKKKVFEVPEEKLWETTQSYVNELYDTVCLYRPLVFDSMNIDTYIIYLMLSKQVKKVPTYLLLKFAEVYEDDLNSLWKNITFSTPPSDKTDPFYSQRLLYNLNMHNAPLLNLKNETEILTINIYVQELIEMKQENQPNDNKVSVKKVQIDRVDNSFGVNNETFNSLKELYKNDIQNYKQKSYKAEQSDHMHTDTNMNTAEIDERDMTESFVIHEYTEFVKYYTFPKFTIKEYIKFLVIQKDLRKFILFGRTIIEEKCNVSENQLSTFLTYYIEDLNEYYKHVMFVDLDENKKTDFYTNQLMFYYTILNAYKDETETMTTLDEFIELIKADAERDTQNESSSTPKKRLTWHKAGLRIIENELTKNVKKTPNTDDWNKRRLSPLENEALEGLDLLLKEKRRKDDGDQNPR